MAKKVVLIGWSGADWSVARPLLEKGQLPSLAALIASGASALLRGFAPYQPAQMAATLLTGAHPDQFLSGVPWVWDTLEKRGLSVFAGGWSGAPDRVPDLLRAAVNEPLEVQDIDQGLLGFFASAEHLGQPEAARRLAPLLRWLVPVYRLHNASVLAASAGTGMIAVGYAFIDAVTQAFASVRNEPAYCDAIPGAYRLMDALLGDLLRHLPAEVDVAVASDHGFTASGLTSPYGLLVVRRDGLAPGGSLGSVSLTEVLPLLLGSAAKGVVPAAAAPSPADAIPTTSPALALSVGRALIGLDRGSDAIGWLHHAFLGSPESRVASLWLCKALLQQGMVEEAAHYAATVFDADGKDPDAILLRAELAVAQNRGKEALAWLSRHPAGGLGPEGEGLRRHAMLQAAQGEEAVAAFKAAISENALEPLLWIGLAHAYLMTGRAASAGEAEAKARELDPRHPALRSLSQPEGPSWNGMMQTVGNRQQLRLQLEERERAQAAGQAAARSGTEPVSYLLNAQLPPPRGGPVVIVTARLLEDGERLMRLLAHCGLPVAADGARAGPTPRGPSGYFQWSRLQSLGRHPRLIERAMGRLLWVPHTLIALLPKEADYLILSVGEPPSTLPAGPLITLDPSALDGTHEVVSRVSRFLGVEPFRWTGAYGSLSP